MQIPHRFVPKKRKKQLYGVVRKFLAKVFYELARQRSSKIIEGEYDTRLRTYIDIDTAKIFGIRGYRVHKREKCDSSSEAVWKQKMNFNREQFWVSG